MRTAALVQSPFHNHLGILTAVAAAMQRSNFPGESFQLKNSGRPVNIHAYQHYAFFVGVDQPFCKLGGGRRLTRSLQPDEHYHDGRLGFEIQRYVIVAKQSNEFTVDDFYECLSGGQALADLFTDGTLPDVFDKRLDDRERDVGEPLLQTGSPMQSGIAMRSGNHRKRIVYRQDGSSGGTNSSFTFCDSRKLARPRVICLSNTGRPRLTKTRCDGKPVDCS